jgi:hypothetical protein
MGEDIIASISGTATFERVEVHPTDDDDHAYRVDGFYDDSVTSYGVPEAGELHIGGLSVSSAHGPIVFEGSPVWVKATETGTLHITAEKHE